MPLDSELDINITSDVESDGDVKITTQSSDDISANIDVGFDDTQAVSADISANIDDFQSATMSVETTDDIEAEMVTEINSSGSLTETDPTVPSHVKSITQENINNWNDKQIIILEDNGSATAGQWLMKSDKVTELKDGMVFMMKIPVAGATTTYLTINSLARKIVYRFNNTKLTTHYSAGMWITFVYNATLNSGSFICVDGYDSTDDGNYTDREYYLRPYTAQALPKYKICALDNDNKLVSFTTTEQTDATIITKVCTTLSFRPERIYFYVGTTKINENAVVGGQTLFKRYYSSTNIAPYNFNEDVPPYREVYIKGTFDKNTGMFTLYHNPENTDYKDWYTFVPNNTEGIVLSDYFDDGYYYILIGTTYSTKNYMCLLDAHPMFYFNGTKLVNGYTNTYVDSTQVNSLIETYMIEHYENGNEGSY